MDPWTPPAWLDQRHIEERFSRSSGPGGQNVNKVETGVQLRVNLSEMNVPAYIRSNLHAQVPHLLTQAGELLIQCEDSRSQAQNRDKAWNRLGDILQKALIRPKKRKSTKPTKASKKRRVDSKKKRGEIKKGRVSVDF